MKFRVVIQTLGIALLAATVIWGLGFLADAAHPDWNKKTSATAWQSDISLNYDTAYCWMVRGSSSNSYSEWSAVGAFTTESPPEPSSRESSPPSEPEPSVPELSSTVLSPPALLSPEAGASGTSLRPVFQWSAIAGAESYELLVATEASFDSPLIVKVDAYALPATAWQSDVSLDYDTTYYWRIRGSTSDGYSAWSAVGAFTTGPPPPDELPVQPDIPAWATYLGVALLTTIVILLITILALVIKARSS